MKKIAIVNGPNLNLLGKRQPEIYGSLTMEEYLEGLKDKFSDKVEIHYFQSNHEGSLIDYLQQVGFTYDGIILNAGGYTHTSIAIADTISAISAPVIEVHISDIKKREAFRHHSFLEAVCEQSIIGKGTNGYEEALVYLLNK